MNTQVRPIETTPVNERSLTVTFRLDGIKEAVEQVAKACHWWKPQPDKKR